jgi:riboflavin synthase alpha subunit
MWESDDDGFDIDAVIEKLTTVSKKTPGSLVNLELDTILKIIEKTKKIIEN